MKSTLLLLTLSVVLSACNGKQTQIEKTPASTKSKIPKNVILLIGDGMGLSQVSLTQYYGDEPSNFERFPTVGLIKTSSESHVITDSGAGATAYAAGVKTYNKAIGMGPDSTAVASIVETVSKSGYATGLVATSSIVHATPASFFAHVKTRYEYEKIATFLPKSDIDFFAGGGLEFFNKRKDSLDLIPELLANDFTLDTIELPSTISEKKHAILLAQNAMPKISEGRGDFLTNATLLAIEKLKTNDKGFFLMVEGSQIDWGCHDQEPDYVIKEQLDFDKTVGRVLDFAQKDEETLVIVTADHETGAFALAMDGRDYGKIKPSVYSGEHSAAMVPVFAFGPGSELFGGVYENTGIYHKMMKLLSRE
ncbi:MAG: alkaline phosphatase [Bacteroidota bacterium]